MRKMKVAARPATDRMVSSAMAQSGMTRSQLPDFMSSIAVARMVLSSVVEAAAVPRGLPSPMAVAPRMISLPR